MPTQSSPTVLERIAQGENIPDPEIDWEKPPTIKAYLDQYVIGQNEAKVSIAVAFSSFATRMRTKDPNLKKSNVLIIGPTGVGKTYMISLLTRKAGIPLVETKATGKAAEGFVGDKLSDVFDALREKTKDKEPYAVVFIDEIDKIAQRFQQLSGTYAPIQQQELIGWLEDATVRGQGIFSMKRPISTKNILFIGAGAFSRSMDRPSLDEIVNARLGANQNSLGFKTNHYEAGEERHDEFADYPLLRVTPQDLIQFGFMPELVGRFGARAVLKPLTEEQKLLILTQAKRSPLRQYSELLRHKGYRIEFDQDTFKVIVEHCPPETGARGLTAVCEDLFTEILYEPDKFAANGTVRVSSSLANELINLHEPANSRLRV